MVFRPNLAKISNRIEKAAKKSSSQKKGQSSNSRYNEDDEPSIEWGEQLENRVSAQDKDATATPVARRVTRGSGLTNKTLYKSIVIDENKYELGQAVMVQSTNDDPYLAIIYRLLENETGEKQVVVRWLFRQSEMFTKRTKTKIESIPNEVFYSNADDYIEPEMITGPLRVLSHDEFSKINGEDTQVPQSQTSHNRTKDPVYFCRKYFNEQTAAVGDLEWSVFYTNKEMLDPAVDSAMFKQKIQKKSKTSDATKTARKNHAKAVLAARATRKKAQSKTTKAKKASTPRVGRKRKISIQEDGEDGEAKAQDYDIPVLSDDDEDSDFAANGDDGDADEYGKPARKARRKTLQTPAKRRKTVHNSLISTPTTPIPRKGRRLRLQDLQPSSTASATLARVRLAKDTLGADPSIHDGSSVYESARARLHVSSVPDTLPCREDEFSDIFTHIYGALEERTSMCLYISGVPGTGKTATVHEVMRALQESTEEGGIPEFQFIELNGMKMTEPNQAYSQLWQAISGARATPKHAAQLLEKHFNTPSPRRHTYVVLMDELDLLVTRSQSIMYNFFDWPHHPHARLIVVAIANTMDLPERMLNHKVSSRLGLVRINFQPYTHNQLFSIVQSRLEGCEAFDPDAIELCARKISAVSGDARRALDVCRRAVEMVEASWQKKDKLGATNDGNGTTQTPIKLVSMIDIDKAVKEMYASGHISFIQSSSLQQKLFLVALRAAIRKAGVPEVTLGDAAFTHRQLCKLHNLVVPTYDQLTKVCAQLGASRCILAESSMLDVHQQLRLGISEDDITIALKPDPLFQKIIST